MSICNMLRESSPRLNNVTSIVVLGREKLVDIQKIRFFAN